MMGKQAVLLAILMLGCAGSQRRARNAVDETRLAAARAVQAEQRAPTAYADYKRAQQQAAVFPEESQERADLEATARLWLETAIAIGEREQLAERRLAEERKLAELDDALAPLIKEREQWARKADLAAARAIARGEAEKALNRAALKPQLRVKIPREEARRTAEALLDRAALIALTLETVSPNAAGLPKLKAKLAESEAMLKDPELSLARADQTLFLALSMLAELRGDDPPSDDEKASLSEELSLIGAQVSRGDQGLTGTFTHSFTGNTLASGAERTLGRLCALSRAHIKGPIRLAARSTFAAQAEARARGLRAALGGAGCQGARFAVVSAPGEDEHLEVSFLAY